MTVFSQYSLHFRLSQTFNGLSYVKNAVFDMLIVPNARKVKNPAS